MLWNCILKYSRKARSFWRSKDTNNNIPNIADNHPFWYTTFCLEILTVHGNELRLFWTEVFPLLIVFFLSNQDLKHSLTDNVTNSSVGHISVVCGPILTFVKVLAPRIWWGSHVWWLEVKSSASAVLMISV